MEIRNAIMQMAEQDPQYAPAIDAMEAQMARMPIVPEDLDQAIQVLEFVLQNPDKYEEVRATAIKDGDIDANMFPEQFDQVYIVSILVALYGVQDRLKKQGYARGGLAVAARRVASAGRGGDSQLAHINPREAEMLKRMGGSGTVNPNTGLHEYKSGKELFATLAPIALSIFVPGLGAAIGGALGASGIGASILGGAIIGGASSAIGGGDWKKGALMGGLGGGLGGVTGKFVAPGASEFAQNIIGGGLVGGAAGAITGQGFLKGAAQGVAGGAIGQLAGQNFGGPTAFEQGVASAGQNFGNALTAGYDPKTAAKIGVVSGLTKGFQTNMKPSDAVVDGLKTDGSTPKMVTLPDGTSVQAPGTAATNAQGQTGTYKLDSATGSVKFVPNAGSYVMNPETNAVEWKAAEPSFMEKALKGSMFETKPSTTVDAKADTGMGTTGKALAGLSLISALQKPPPMAQDAISKMSPEQQEYFNRPSVTWDWTRMQNDANAANVSLDRFMAENWPRITGYAQTQPGQVSTQQGAYNQPSPIGKARGGALSAVARFAQGAGSGRADTIDAKLSDGEYVIDAETVAMLGDGSNKEGANRLDAMRGSIRSHKGKALARGKFSPNAKSPLAYLKGVA